MADSIGTAIEMLTKIREEDEVTVKFRKRDNSERVMRCTLNFDKIPDNQKPKSVNLPKILELINKHKIIHVYDLDRKEWRSIPFDRSEYLDTAAGRFKIRR